MVLILNESQIVNKQLEEVIAKSCKIQDNPNNKSRPNCRITLKASPDDTELHQEEP
jgi:hypothetical protein